MREKLISAFPSVQEKQLSDGYIESHTDLFWDIPEIPLIEAVPLYMLWCIEHIEDEGSLVFDGILGALNTYAREKKEDSFRDQCTSEQKETVRQFLNWCKSNLSLDYDPVLSRTIKNWKNC